MTSQDHFRPAETMLGLGGIGVSAIGMIKEEQKSIPVMEPRGIIPNLKRDFMAVAGFAGDRCIDLVSEGVRIDRSIAKTFHNACIDISFAGPNRVAAKTWNTLVYPWVIESIYYNDWRNVAAAMIYRTGNYFYERSSKRALPAVHVAPSFGA